MRLLAILCAVVVTIVASAGLAAPPEETFDRVYGDQLKKVNALRDSKASGEFAQTMVKDAVDLKDDPDFQALVFTKAYEIALRVSAFSTAEDAMEKLAAAQPVRRRAADEKLMIALEREHRPALRAKLDAVKARVIAEKKLEQLEHAVGKTPNKKDAAEIVRLLLVEFDDPAKALTFAPATGDTALQHAVDLANRQINDLAEPDAKELGDWYQSHGTAASPSGRASALGRAKTCYERFLTLHTAKDASQLEVKRHLDVIAHLESTSPAPQPVSGRIIDLLKLVDVSTDTVAGTWTRGDDGVTSDGGYGRRVRIPYEPPAEYDIRMIFTVRADRGAAGLLLAHNDAEFFWRVDWTEAMCRFEGSNIPNGRTAVEMDKKFAAGSKHEVIVKVRSASVSTFLDGKPMGQFTGDYSKAAVQDYWFIGNHSIGFTSHGSAQTFHSVEMVEVAGHGKLSPKAAK